MGPKVSNHGMTKIDFTVDVDEEDLLVQYLRYDSDYNLTISSRPETLWGLTKMMAQDGANCVRRSAPSFLQSPDPFCSPQRVIMMAQFPSHVGWKNKYCGPKTHHPMQF